MGTQRNPGGDTAAGLSARCRRQLRGSRLQASRVEGTMSSEAGRMSTEGIASAGHVHWLTQGRAARTAGVEGIGERRGHGWLPWSEAWGAQPRGKGSLALASFLPPSSLTQPCTLPCPYHGRRQEGNSHLGAHAPRAPCISPMYGKTSGTQTTLAALETDPQKGHLPGMWAGKEKPGWGLAGHGPGSPCAALCGQRGRWDSCI